MSLFLLQMCGGSAKMVAIISCIPLTPLLSSSLTVKKHKSTLDVQWYIQMRPHPQKQLQPVTPQ